MIDLKVTLVQTYLNWEHTEENLKHFSNVLGKLTEQTDLIVLPEMFTTGFTMKPELLAENHGGKGLQWMQETAHKKNCVITGSISVKDKAGFYNRLYWVKPDGSFNYYDKRHLFRMGHEQEHYSQGTKKMIVELKGWKLCPLVCYDLRFPVWSRNNMHAAGSSWQAEYDVLIYVANWPQVRSYPWKQLLIARAIENQCYTIGVNRIGRDGNLIEHSGDSGVINPKGEIISCIKANEDKLETIILNYQELSDFRKTFPVLSDADRFTII